MIAPAIKHRQAGEFRREMLPEPNDYFAQFGPITGKGIQRGGGCAHCGGSDPFGYRSDTGAHLCRSCGAKGGDVLDHYMQLHGVGFVDAARALGAWIENGNGNGNGNGKKMEAASTFRPVKAHARPVEPSVPATMPDYGRELLRESTGLHGTVAAAYLLARRCRLPPQDTDLRFHPSAKHRSGYAGPCMLGPIVNAATGEPMGAHRTWVAADGSKPVTPAKMTLGRKQGGVVRLWPNESVTTGLAIAEGIETALSMAHDYAPVWSVIDAGNMAAFPVLPGIECLVIGADHDEAGLRAAQQCAERWAASGVDVRVLIPATAGTDWNDVEAQHDHV